jgi:hypothetical protein
LDAKDKIAGYDRIRSQIYHDLDTTGSAAKISYLILF